AKESDGTSESPSLQRAKATENSKDLKIPGFSEKKRQDI
ncbi:hypothetical protein A2U01_0109595, partial [Trifolium medium]|nr:hypothetical protein [Trifolium medium]